MSASLPSTIPDAALENAATAGSGEGKSPQPPHLGAGHFIRSAFTLGLAQGVSWVGAAVLTVMLPRYLGDAGLGKLSFALVLTMLVGLGATLGTETYVSREVARDPGSAPRLLTAALTVRLPLSILVAAGTALGVSLLPTDVVTRQTVYVLCAGVVLSAFEIVFGILQGFHRMKALAAISVGSKLSLAAVAAAILLAGGGPTKAAIAWVAGQAVGLLIGYGALLRVMKPSVRLESKLAWGVLVGGLPFCVWQAALIVYGQVDTLILKFLANDAVIGWYGAAYRLVSLGSFVPVIILLVTFPALSAAVGDPARFSAISRRALQVVLLPTVPIALGTMLLPDKLTGFLGYPPSFDNSWWPMILLAPHMAMVAADMVIGTILNACDRQRRWALVAVSAAILNPLANLVAIPYTQHHFGNGAIGAALITTLTETSLMFVGLRLLPAGILGMASVRDVLKILLAGLLMAVLVVAMRGFPLLIVVGLGAIVYAAACLLLGAFTRADLAEVAGHLTRRVKSG